MITVKIDFGDYQLNVHLEGDYQTEKQRLGDAFEEAMYQRAIEQTEKDRWTLPPLPSFFEVTE
ncbi:hypothetical protein P4U97_01265 [Bacillus swezeyi]|uniref:hypothetical protein n=1 Tax=Bacillus swezeyi TaxID=1925020 RepID=UPI002E2217DC|nr:hypothetical protein [Bacillus swezeyi]